jgi:hypothetical protein
MVVIVFEQINKLLHYERIEYFLYYSRAQAVYIRLVYLTLGFSWFLVYAYRYVGLARH